MVWAYKGDLIANVNTRECVRIKSALRDAFCKRPVKAIATRVEMVHPVRPFRCIPNVTWQWQVGERSVKRLVLIAVH